MKLPVKCDFCNANLKRYKTKTQKYFCGFTCKSKWQIQQRENLGFTKEWLIDQYFNKKKNCDMIAAEINRDPKSVWNWFKGYNIKMNPRGAESSSGSFKPGHKKGVGRIHTKATKDKIRDARLKDGHVPYLKDGKHWLTGISKENHPLWKGGLTPERQSVYSSIEWSEVVKKVWKRDNATCQKCSKHQSDDRLNKFHIHHIITFQKRETRTHLSNLILLCPICHRWVHGKKNINKLFIK